MRDLLIIPARNEELNLPGVLQAVHAACPRYDVAVIDDASTDATARVAREAGATVLPLPCHLGYGGAVQTGLKYACRRGYDRVALMDADGQHDPGELVKLEQAFAETGADLIIGSRFLGEGDYRMPLGRRAGAWFFALLTSWLIGRRMTDTTSGFQLLSRRAVELLAREYPIDFPDAEVIVLVGRVGLSVVEVPVRVYPRKAGRSMFSFARSLYYPFKVTLATLMAVLRALLLERRCDLSWRAAAPSTEPRTDEEHASGRGQDPAARGKDSP